MPIIFSYPQVSTVSNQDLFVISRTSSGIPETKSVEAEEISTYVKSTVDLNVVAQDASNTIVNLASQSLSITGTTNEIETRVPTGQVLQIGLPDNVTIVRDLTVGVGFGGGNLTVGSSNSQSQIAGYLDLTEVLVNDTLDVGGDTTLNNDLDVGGNAQIGGSLDMTLSRINNVLDPFNAQDAATKNYVDTAVTGLLEFKGTFRADSGLILSGGNAGSYIYNCPGGAGTRVAISVGDYYIVANTGGQFYCSGDLLNVGDSIFCTTDAAADTSTISDWGTLESDNIEGTGLANTVPLWTDSQVLGNSNITQNPGGSITISENLLVDQKEIEAGTMIINGVAEITGEINKAGTKIINLADPTAAQDAATKAYVDSLTTTNADDIADLQTDVGTNANNISTNTSNISTNTSNISSNTTAIAGKVAKAGDTMSGDLTILKTTSNPALRVQSEEIVGGSFQAAIVNVRSKDISTNTETVGSITAHGPNSINTGGASNIVIQNQTSAGGQVVIAPKGGATTYWNRFKTNGQVQFEEYGSGTLTGTAAYNISVDASGNLIETPNSSGGGAWTTLEVNLSGNVLVNAFNGNLSDAITLVTVPANHFAKILEVTGVIYGASSGTTDYNPNNSLYVKRVGSVTGGSFSAPEISGSFLASSGDRLTNSNGQPVAAQTNNLSSYGGLGSDIVLGPSTTGPVTITQGDRTIKLSITYRLIDFTP
jgi:hypothetical protein